LCSSGNQEEREETKLKKRLKVEVGEVEEKIGD